MIKGTEIEENEDLIEQLYWEFDAERKSGKNSERDVFKWKMRHFAAEVLAAREANDPD